MEMKQQYNENHIINSLLKFYAQLYMCSSVAMIYKYAFWGLWLHLMAYKKITIIHLYRQADSAYGKPASAYQLP